MISFIGVESVASSEPNNTQTTTDQDEPVDDGKPKMVKKIRKVLVVKEERNERGYLGILAKEANY